MRIDVHAHVQPPEYLKLLLNSGRYEVERGESEQIILKEKGARFLTITPQMHNPELRLAEMDAAGVDMQVLSITVPQIYFVQGQEAVDLAIACNDYLADIVRQYPDRFRVLASIPLTADVDSAINELARCMDTLGMPGFIIGANIDGGPIDDPKYDPFFEEANRRGAVMFLHPMVPAGIEAMGQYAMAPLVGSIFDTTQAVTRLIYSDFFGRFLGINVVVAHLGAAVPYLAGRFDIGYRAYPECQRLTRPPSEVIERLYLDTVSFYEPALRMALEVVGPDHILFGSDSPQVTGDMTAAIQTIEDVAARRDRTKILGDNAARLYRISG